MRAAQVRHTYSPASLDTVSFPSGNLRRPLWWRCVVWGLAGALLTPQVLGERDPIHGCKTRGSRTCPRACWMKVVTHVRGRDGGGARSCEFQGENQAHPRRWFSEVCGRVGSRGKELPTSHTSKDPTLSRKVALRPLGLPGTRASSSLEAVKSDKTECTRRPRQLPHVHSLPAPTAPSARSPLVHTRGNGPRGGLTLAAAAQPRGSEGGRGLAALAQDVGD